MNLQSRYLWQFTTTTQTGVKNLLHMSISPMRDYWRLTESIWQQVYNTANSDGFNSTQDWTTPLKRGFGFSLVTEWVNEEKLPYWYPCPNPSLFSRDFQFDRVGLFVFIRSNRKGCQRERHRPPDPPPPRLPWAGRRRRTRLLGWPRRTRTTRSSSRYASSRATLTRRGRPTGWRKSRSSRPTWSSWSRRTSLVTTFDGIYQSRKWYRCNTLNFIRCIPQFFPPASKISINVCRSPIIGQCP